MLSAGENMLWVAKQMGHVDTEMIIKTYGKWIPDPASKNGYTFVNNWSNILNQPFFQVLLNHALHQNQLFNSQDLLMIKQRFCNY